MVYKVLQKRDYENYPEYITRILEPDSDEDETSYKQRLKWIKKHLPTVGQSDDFKRYYNGNYKQVAETPLKVLRNKAVRKLDKLGQHMKALPLLSKRSRIILTSQVFHENCFYSGIFIRASYLTLLSPLVL